MGDDAGSMMLVPGATGVDAAPHAWVSAIRPLIVAYVMAGMPAQAGESESDQPIVDRVAGNCYERRVLDAAGRLNGHQRIRVRDATYGPNGPVARIDVVKFRTGDAPGGELQIDERFEFGMLGDIAEDAQEEAALQIVGYLGSDSRVSLDFLDQTVIYPAGLCHDQDLPPVRLNLSAAGGLADLLGGRAEIRITDRTCRSAGDGESYFIEADLQMKVYLMGIRLRNERYRSRQLVDPQQGLVQHVLEKPGGSRQELNMVEPALCTPPWQLSVKD